MPEEVTIGFEFRNRRFRDAQKGVEALADELGASPRRMSRALRKELEKFLRAVRDALRQRHSTPWRPGGSPADRLYRRTGAGIAGIRTRAFMANPEDLNTLTGLVTVPFPLSVHETGATIRARRTQYLAIPLPTALDNRGVPLRPRPRDWDNTFVRESRRGNLLIFQRRGTGIIPLYLLKREVQLPARLGVQTTLMAGLDFFVDTAIDAAAKAITRGL